MAKAAPTFFDMDVSKYMGAFKMPMVDVDAMMASHRKNIEAVTAANQVAIEGFGALVRRQQEIAREAMESCTSVFKELTAEGSPEEKVARSADLTKGAYEKAVATSRELGDMVAKTQTEAFGVINDRFRASFDEVKGFAANGAAAAATPTKK